MTGGIKDLSGGVRSKLSQSAADRRAQQALAEKQDQPKPELGVIPEDVGKSGDFSFREIDDDVFFSFKFKGDWHYARAYTNPRALEDEINQEVTNITVTIEAPDGTYATLTVTGTATFTGATIVGLDHSSLDGIGADDHHAQSHSLASHSTKAHSELSGVGTDDHHAEAHAVASHSDTTATGAELEILTDGSNADSLHDHDHGAISGLGDDDHTQYLNVTRHSAIGDSSPHHAAVSVVDTNSVDLTLSTQQITADVIVQNTTEINLTIDGSGVKANINFGAVGNITDVSLTAASAGSTSKPSKIDHRHVLSQSIAPTWTKEHNFVPTSKFVYFGDTTDDIELGNKAGFVSSLFTGSGWRLTEDANNWELELDNMYLRGTLTVWELLINQIRATNGSVVISSAAKVESVTTEPVAIDGGTISFVAPNQINDSGSGFIAAGFRDDPGTPQTIVVVGSGLNDGTYTVELAAAGALTIYEAVVNEGVGNAEITISNSYLITFEVDDDGVQVHPFAKGDLILAKRVNLAESGSPPWQVVVESRCLVVAHTTGIANGAKDAFVTLEAGTTLPVKGYDFVRLGSEDDSTRRGGIYLTSDDIYPSFIDIWDDVSSWTTWDATGKVKMRIGQLEGVTSVDEHGMTAVKSTNEKIILSNQTFEVHGIKVDLYASGVNTFRIDPSGPSLAMGATLPTAFGTGDGIWMGLDTLYKFRAGIIGGKRIEWDGADFNIFGTTVRLNSSTPSFAMGNPLPTAYDTNTGLWTGLNGGVYKWRVGNPPSGKRIEWDGADFNIFGTTVRLNSSVPSFALGSPLPTTPVDANPGIWMGLHSAKYKFRVGDYSNNQYLLWNGVDISVKGKDGFLYTRDGNDYLLEGSHLFGDGSDGSVTLDYSDSDATKVSADAEYNDNIITYTATGKWALQRDVYLSDLTIVQYNELSTNGYRLFVRDTLIIPDDGIVHNDGGDGVNGADGTDANSVQPGLKGTGGAGGAGGDGGNFFAGKAGPAGGDGGDGVGGSLNGEDGESGGVGIGANPCINNNAGSSGGNGASGGTSGAYTGGSGYAGLGGGAVTRTKTKLKSLDPHQLITLRDIYGQSTTFDRIYPSAGPGGSGGGGGGGANGGNSGGGGGAGGSGGSGGVCMVCARIISVGTNTRISANGGDGGDGGDGAAPWGAAANGGLAGGGSGGNGGALIVVTSTDTSTLTCQSAGGALGTKGSAGNGTGATDGNVGSAGNTILIRV